MAIVDVKLQRGATCDLRYDYKEESAQEVYRIQLDALSRDFAGMVQQAASTSSGYTNPLPARGARYPHSGPYALYQEGYQCSLVEANQLYVDVTVNYSSLKAGEEDRASKGTNPLTWPPEYQLSWIEEEYVVERAYNVDTIGPPGKERDPQLGPVVNGALQEFDEPIMATRRKPVLHITYNVPNLGITLDLNQQYQGTTNSDTFTLSPGVTVQPRQAEFLVAETSGRQEANGVDYFAMTLNIAVHKTTEREINNVGWNEWSTTQEALVPCKVTDEESGEKVRPSEPQFLKLDGTRAETGTAPTIKYRYLEAVPYLPLLQG